MLLSWTREVQWKAFAKRRFDHKVAWVCLTSPQKRKSSQSDTLLAGMKLLKIDLLDRHMPLNTIQNKKRETCVSRFVPPQVVVKIFITVQKPERYICLFSAGYILHTAFCRILSYSGDFWLRES